MIWIYDKWDVIPNSITLFNFIIIEKFTELLYVLWCLCLLLSFFQVHSPIQLLVNVWKFLFQTLFSTYFMKLHNFCSVFTPQPFGLEGYCRHGSGGRAGGCQTCGTHISVTAWQILSIRSSVELSRPVDVMVICLFAPYGLAHGPKTCQICHKLGPDFAERISLKLLDGFTPFKVLWTCLDL